MALLSAFAPTDLDLLSLHLVLTFLLVVRQLSSSFELLLLRDVVDVCGGNLCAHPTNENGSTFCHAQNDTRQTVVSTYTPPTPNLRTTKTKTRRKERSITEHNSYIEHHSYNLEE